MIRWKRAILLMIVFGMAALWNWARDPIRYLRSNAGQYYEYHATKKFTRKYVRCVRARCGADVFEEFARRDGLKNIVSESLPPDCPGWSSTPDELWDPPESLAGAYFKYEPGKYRRLLAYRDGYLYYEARSW